MMLDKTVKKISEWNINVHDVFKYNVQKPTVERVRSNAFPRHHPISQLIRGFLSRRRNRYSPPGCFLHRWISFVIVQHPAYDITDLHQLEKDILCLWLSSQYIIIIICWECYMVYVREFSFSVYCSFWINSTFNIQNCSNTWSKKINEEEKYVHIVIKHINVSCRRFERLGHRLNMELDLRSLFGLLCTTVLIGWDPATPPFPRTWAHIRGRLATTLS